MQIITEVARLVAQLAAPSPRHCQDRPMSLIANVNRGTQSLARYAQREPILQTALARPVQQAVTVLLVPFLKSFVLLALTALTPQ